MDLLKIIRYITAPTTLIATRSFNDSLIKTFTETRVAWTTRFSEVITCNGERWQEENGKDCGKRTNLSSFEKFKLKFSRILELVEATSAEKLSQFLFSHRNRNF